MAAGQKRAYQKTQKLQKDAAKNKHKNIHNTTC